MLTAERLKELLHYDPETGIFTWLKKSARREAGSVAGCLCRNHHYRIIGIDGVLYRANRLAWLYMTGEWPTSLVDHKNLDRDDDRWENLRVATHSQNHANSGIMTTNTSGFKGVTWHPQTQKWRARVRGISLGLYETREEAHEAYRIGSQQLYGDYARAS